jgi:LacI family transcriptional regulator
VEQAAKELGYEPDFLAQSLRSGHTRMVGFVLRDISNPLFANVARRCEQELRRSGYSMIITSSDGDLASEAANLQLLRRRKVDAVIVSLVSETAPSTVSALRRFTVPVVLLDREVDGMAAAAVLSNHYAGVRSATDALLAQGHRRIALITGPLDVRSSRERFRAYRDGHAHADVAVDSSLTVFHSFNPDPAEADVSRLLTAAAPPTAILAGGFGPTVGAARAVRRLHKGLGKEVVIVALDEWPGFDALAPAMPSVFRDSDELGTASARLAIDMLQGADARVETVDTVYVPRG